MKKAIVSLLVILGFSFSNLQAQAPAGYEKGTIILADNSKQEGLIKESLNSKGTVSFMTATGSKKTYSVAELNGFSYKNDIYIAYTNDFYKAIAIGSKASLYQKQTNNAGKLLYNGSDAYTATTTEGNIGDFYIQANKSDDLLLVNAKNFSSVLSKSFADCSVVLADIAAKQLDYAQLTKAVEKYNSCK
jgi:hypothetical protein